MMATEKRLIDANAFREFLEEIRQDYREEDTLSSGFATCLIETVQDEYLALAPTVDAVEVVHGRWEDVYGGKYQNKRFRCSVCKEKALFKFGQDELLSWHEEQKLSHYCPNCGAKMDGDGIG